MATHCTPLEEHCAALGVSTDLTPGLDPDGPGLEQPGDGRYVLGSQIGRGGSARVYLAADRTLRRTVALKVLDPREALAPLRVQQFLEEAIVSSALEHPNILSVHDVGYIEGVGFYSAMNLLVGMTLEEVLCALRTGEQHATEMFGTFRLLAVFVDVCRAVAYAHTRGVVHTDVKPANIHIGRQGEVRVLDWGLAQVLGPAGAGQARARLCAGTPAYMAPEVIRRDAALDPACDVWSLGVLLYEIVTLLRPFWGATREDLFAQIEHAEPLPLAERPGRDVDAELQRLVGHALAKDRSQRFASANELLRAAEAYLTSAREQRRRHDLGREAERAGWIALEDAERLRVRGGRPTATLTALEGAGNVILNALLGSAEAELLEDAAGELYWRVFAGLDVFTGEMRPRAIALLAALAEVALPAVVRAGWERVGRGSASALEPHAETDPWLAIALAYCRDPVGPVVGTEIHSLVARTATLKRTALFGALPSVSLLAVAAAFAERTYEPGVVLFREGDEPTALFVVTEGRIAIERAGTRLTVIERGEVLGEVSLLGRRPRTATAIAETTTSCLVIGADSFRSLARRNGEIGAALLHVLSERLAGATDREVRRR